jgi:hypothetical protein
LYINFSFRKKDECQFYDVATQIKLLLDTPEKVWSAIDTGNYLQATQLYLLARHINTALQLDSQQSAKIHSWFPVLARQWAAISHFRMTILQGCKEVLKNADISEQVSRVSASGYFGYETSTLKKGEGTFPYPNPNPGKDVCMIPLDGRFNLNIFYALSDH